MNDKILRAALMKMLARFEQKMDWVGETPIRHRVSELIVEIRMVLKDGVK